MRKMLKTSVESTKRKRKDAGNSPNFPAIQLLRNPQSFGKKLYDLLQNAPAILAALAQSVHALTPPDALTPAIRKLAHEFVEMYRRQPWAMEEDLLGDLIAYWKSKDRGVRRERGKIVSMGLAQDTQPAPWSGWIDVESDGGDHLKVSDSEDEDKKSNGKLPENEGPSTEANRTSTLAMTKPPPRQSRAGVVLLAKRVASSSGADDTPTFVSESDILGLRKKAKADYEERVASIARGREGQEKFGSPKGRCKKETPSTR
ncbi:hypothetical protein BJY52DRAFT_1186957 [Lactarius psammicola]|nr:hypothetical protein BJY52DRAFT_1186957 [Lactarius psammicola]